MIAVPILTVTCDFPGCAASLQVTGWQTPETVAARLEAEAWSVANNGRCYCTSCRERPAVREILKNARGT